MYSASLGINISSQWHPRTKPRAQFGSILSKSEVANEPGLLKTMQPPDWDEITSGIGREFFRDQTGQEKGVSCPTPYQASLFGSMKPNVAPSPGLLVAKTSPPWFSIIPRAMDSPSPVPSLPFSRALSAL